MRKVFLARVVLLGVLVALAFATLGALLYLDGLVDAQRAGTPLGVRVVDAQGATRFEGVVVASAPDAVAALLAAAEAGKFPVATADGRVVAVDGEAGDWTWRAWRAGEPLPAGDALAAGDLVEWRPGA